MRINTHWSKTDKERTVEDVTSTVAFISWKIAMNGVLEIENQGYKTHDNKHRLQIIAEFLAFLLQVADRLVYKTFNQDQRQQFITSLALQLTNTFADNQQDILGKGEHSKIFIDLLNQRAEEYAVLSFPKEEAGFDFLRYFGEKIADLMEEKHFLSQQVMDIEGPNAIKTLKKSMLELLNI
ncbi:MAG: hypothetical protein KAH84_01860 [Thiomargarita sp.]|nr:hypothetical protein [Thiomargarita sp.]